MFKVLSGKGVHTGTISKIELASHKGRFLEINLGEFSDALNVGFRHPEYLEANYCTLIKERKTGKCFYTPEHFLACLYTWSEAAANISCFGNEIPGMDGSAFFLNQKILESFSKMGILPQPPLFITSLLNKSYSIPAGSFKVKPHSHFKIRYQVLNSSIKEAYTFEWKEGELADKFKAEIAPARTFILWKNYAKALKNGLLKGAEIESGILLAESQREYEEARKDLNIENLEAVYPTINCSGFRLKNECARHKILDFLGDLAWCGLVLPKLEIQITNGGHFHHLKFVKDLIYERISANAI